MTANILLPTSPTHSFYSKTTRCWGNAGSALSQRLVNVSCLLGIQTPRTNSHKAELFLYKPWRLNGYFHFEIIINVLVWIGLPMLSWLWVLVYGQYKFFNSSSSGTVFIRQNLTSTDVRFRQKLTSTDVRFRRIKTWCDCDLQRILALTLICSRQKPMEKFLTKQTARDFQFAADFHPVFCRCKFYMDQNPLDVRTAFILPWCWLEEGGEKLTSWADILWIWRLSLHPSLDRRIKTRWWP